MRELVEVEYDGFVDDRRVGGRWNGSEALLESGLGTVEDTFALGLGGGGAALTLELDERFAMLVTLLVALTRVGLDELGASGRARWRYVLGDRSILVSRETGK